ncbi:hypothetical protein ASF58_16660 [Methylobacterium sp. Leaf125]|jgi:hypothetical protein|uniref:hypothetical protein n=1 Tax=Methylobacterium sp. Leaf125 TaxID=1736265 RepID=UPI0006FC64B0|nr:hypothetical protein [Methylobacterium sp. Leaf125]KQQ24211.1 hypothetical protein ASF58_16660 [Methylobacterium sp. Leaf125]
MTDAHPSRASIIVLEAAITQMRARHEQDELRDELAVTGLSVLHLASCAYARGAFPPSEARYLCPGLLALADALPANPDDRREPREVRA